LIVSIIGLLTVFVYCLGCAYVITFNVMNLRPTWKKKATQGLYLVYV